MVRSSGTYNTDYSSHPILLQINCPLEFLRFNIEGRGRVSIWDTPHYEFWGSDTGKEDYKKYICQYYGSEQVETSFSKFESLPNFLDKEPEINCLLGRVIEPWSDWLLIVDGNHRAALAAHRKESTLKVFITDR